MLNFRNTSIVFILALIIMIVLCFYMHVPVILFIAVGLLYATILFWGSYFVRSNFYIKTICAANTDKKEIAISFDDGPAQSFTPEILQVLKENNIAAAFFCIGSRIGGNEKLLQTISEEGHIIGNHSFSHHFWFDLFSAKKMLADMKLMDEVVRSYTGLTPKLFRPPYGVTNVNLGKAIKKGNYIPIGWNVRSMDTVITDEKKLLSKVMQGVKPGAVILFHDTSKTTLNILNEFIRNVKAEGYNITRLDKMLNLNPYA
jgi:peptidoglycan-N-acetylglucosamine deacetylase